MLIQEKLLKPLGGYVGYNQEWRELAQVISRVSDPHTLPTSVTCGYNVYLHNSLRKCTLRLCGCFCEIVALCVVMSTGYLLREPGCPVG